MIRFAGFYFLTPTVFPVSFYLWDGDSETPLTVKIWDGDSENELFYISRYT